MAFTLLYELLSSGSALLFASVVALTLRSVPPLLPLQLTQLTSAVWTYCPSSNEGMQALNGVHSNKT